jgi:ubiquinone/menaquinone biosynthesis C-methylase UbiE
VGLHPIAARGFGSSAEAYERGRPDYPAEAIAWLAKRAGLGPGVTVIDLAAGTGKLTRPIAATSARVIAVEPVEEMRRAIGPAAEALEGTAEAMPLADGSADLVTVGQAFHWFDGDAALAEIHRVLRPRGLLALLWNVRAMDDPVHIAIEEVIAPYCGDVPRHRSGEWRKAFAHGDRFGPLEEARFAFEQRLDAAGLADRIGSTSAIAALADDERERVLGRIRPLAGSGEVSLPYTCEVQVTTALGR